MIEHLLVFYDSFLTYSIANVYPRFYMKVTKIAAKKASVAIIRH